MHINSAVEQANGEVALLKAVGRTVPHALIDNQTASCWVEAVPFLSGPGFDYITGSGAPTERDP